VSSLSSVGSSVKQKPVAAGGLSLLLSFFHRRAGRLWLILVLFLWGPGWTVMYLFNKQDI
jgi:hypothetical protein